MWTVHEYSVTMFSCFLLQIVYKQGVSAGVLPSIPYAEILTYTFSTAFLFHAVRTHFLFDSVFHSNFYSSVYSTLMSQKAIFLFKPWLPQFGFSIYGLFIEE